MVGGRKVSVTGTGRAGARAQSEAQREGLRGEQGQAPHTQRLREGSAAWPTLGDILGRNTPRLFHDHITLRAGRVLRG